MKISNVIEKLEQIRAVSGNIDVCDSDGNGISAVDAWEDSYNKADIVVLVDFQAAPSGWPRPISHGLRTGILQAA
jgi:hypothetical protein